MDFFRRLLGIEQIDELISITVGWQELFYESQRQKLLSELLWTRTLRDTIEKFLIELDHPERQEELRAELQAALKDLNDEVARAEEQVV